MMLVARLARQDHDELQNQIGPRDTHGFGYVGAYVCASKRKCDARRSVGSVSSNSWGVGDLRPALRETEIVLALNKRHPKSSERVQPGSLPFLRVTGGTAPTAGDYGVTSVVSAIEIIWQQFQNEDAPRCPMLVPGNLCEYSWLRYWKL